MNVGIYFSFLFTLNLLFCFFLVWPSIKEEESTKDSVFNFFSGILLFLLICAIYSQLVYMSGFILPILFSSRLISFFIPILTVALFFSLAKFLLNVSYFQRRAIICFVLLNSLVLFIPYSKEIAVRSPLYTLLLGILPCISWIIALFFSHVIIERFELGIPKFSVFNFPILIISIGLILLMLTPLMG